MQKPETRFIQRINRLLPLLRGNNSGAGMIHYEKMNNPYRSGTADSWYSGEGGDLWVEWKFVDKIPRSADGTTLCINAQRLLRPMQTVWLNGRLAEGRKVVVIIGCEKGGVILENGEWNEIVNISTSAKSAAPNEECVKRLQSAVEIALFVKRQTLHSPLRKGEGNDGKEVYSLNGGDI